jgi:predicted phosphodiesterase
MKIALIADIHGNIVALDAVLAAIEIERPDRVVCLGDVAAKGPAPAQVIDRLIDRDWIFIMGNTDEWMPRPFDETPATERDRLLIAAALWGFDQLDERQRAFIAAFRPNAAVELGAGQLLCYHGSPDSNVTSILPETPQADLDRLLNPWPAHVYAGAHTHVQMLRPRHASLLINPGSAGMASATRPHGEEHLVAQAEFAFVEADSDGIRVDFRSIELDRAALVESVRKSTTPDAAWWSENWSR